MAVGFVFAAGWNRIARRSTWLDGIPALHRTAQSATVRRKPVISAVGLLVPVERVVTAVVLHVGLSGLGMTVGKSLLTPAGVIHACLLGILLWCSMGLPGWILTALFFVLGSIGTKVGMDVKKREGTAEKRDGARGPENVWGSAGPAAICALIVLFAPVLFASVKMQRIIGLLAQLGYTGAIATKLSDSLSSEIGKAYGRTTILLTSFKVVPRGTEGAVSLEGTLAGIAGSVVIALVAWYFMLIPYLDIPIVIVAAFLANVVESVIGSTFQDKMKLSNEFVNVINTACGAVFSIALRVLVTWLAIFY